MAARKNTACAMHKVILIIVGNKCGPSCRCMDCGNQELEKKT